jgi:hypothetical protein
MTPEQQQLTDRFLRMAADDANQVDIIDVANSGFALVVWSLSRAYFPADQRDMLLAMFTTQLPQRVASMLEESGHNVKFGTVQ